MIPKKIRVCASGDKITMRTLENAIIATILILFGQPVQAGIVMSETEVQSGLGASNTINKTVYVQGNKQKIETSRGDKIIDLQRSALRNRLHPKGVEGRVRNPVPPAQLADLGPR